MRKKRIFKQLVIENKSEILNSEKAIEEIEKRIDEKHIIKEV
jgi:hypothetical protein